MWARVQTFFFSLLALLLIIEEWLWAWLTRLGARLSRWLRLQTFEQWLLRATPLQALVCFATPLLLVVPINVLGFLLMANGAFWRGVLVEIGAKLFGTLIVARIFKLAKPQLLSFSAIAFLYRHITSWLQWAHARIITTGAYQTLKSVKEKFRRG